MVKDYDDIKIPKNLDNYIKNGIDEAVYDIENDNVRKIDKEINNMNNKKNGLSKIAITTAILCSALVLTNESTIAGIKSIVENANTLSSVLNSRKNIDDYSTIVNTTVSDNGIDITLSEVLLDTVTNEMYILSYIRSDMIDNSNLNFHSFSLGFPDIYINGKLANYSGGGNQEYAGENLIEDIKTISIDKDVDLTGDVEIKIKYKSATHTDYLSDFYEKYKDLEYEEYSDTVQVAIIEGDLQELSVISSLDSVVTKGDWTFEFISNGDDLAMKTEIIPINQEILINDGKNSVIFNKYITNDLSQKIIFTFAGFDDLITDSKFADLRLEGVDNLGNNISTGLSSMGGGIGVFEIDKYGIGMNSDIIYANSIDEDAEYLKLSLYTRIMEMNSGKLPGDFVKSDEEIIIYLKK